MNIQKFLPKQVLAHSPLFQELSAGELEAIATQARFKSLNKGQTLFSQGDLADALYVVAAGLIKVFQPNARKGRQLVLSLEGQFRLIDPAPVLLEPPLHQASAEALEDSVLLVIPRPVFLNLIDAHSPLSKALVRFLAKRQRQTVLNSDTGLCDHIGHGSFWAQGGHHSLALPVSPCRVETAMT